MGEFTKLFIREAFMNLEGIKKVLVGNKSFLLKYFPVEYKTHKKELLFTELHKFPEFPLTPKNYGQVILERQIHDPGDKYDY